MSAAARRDALWAAVAAGIVALLLSLTDGFEWWHRATREHELWELDEFFGLAIAALLAAFWYSWRRVAEARRELRRRIDAEGRLRDSMEQFQAVLDNAPVEIYVKDHESRNLVANRRAHELFAPSDGIMVGRTTRELSPTQDAERYIAQDREVIESGQASRWTYELLLGGDVRHYFTIKFPISDAAGEVTQVGSIVTDITEIREREVALRNSEEQLRAIVDNTPCGITLKDAAGRYILINRWYESRLGQSSDKLYGKTSHEIFPKDFAESGIAQDRAVLESGAVIEQEESWTLADGPHTLFTVKFPVQDSAGTVVSIGSITTDISERKRAEEKDRVNRARLQAIMDFSPLALYLKDPEGRLLIVNKRFEEWYGIDADRALGKRLKEIIADGGSDDGEEQEILRTGEVRQREVSRPAGAGGERTTMIADFPVFDGQGGVLGTGGAEIDITALKQAQAALQSAKDTADRANAAKSRFLAAASHDLRQPLHALNLLIDALGEEGEAAGRAAIVDAMQQAASSMGEMLNALLDISQLDAGVIKPELHSFGIGPFLEDLVRSIAPRADVKGLDLRMVPSSIVVRSDRILLGRIVENLLSNAVRYTSEGKILIGCRRRAKGLRIEVWDSGVGIAPEHQDKIFEEYFQLGNPARDRSKGLGLGLAIVDRVARILNHRVELHSLPGRGSLFAIEVPYAPRGEGGSSVEDSVTAGGELRGSRVLLIEDDPLVMEWTQRLLQGWDVEVQPAATGAGFRKSLSDAPQAIDLIIADFRLPGGKSGLDLIQEARKIIGSAVPAVVVTGDTTSDLSRRCAEADCTLLHKPIAPAKLRSLMRWLLTERRID